MRLATRLRTAPVSDLDPWADSALIDPWATYAALQNLGSAVWLNKHQMFALTRYDSVIQALRDGSAFSLASGVMMNDAMNEVLRGNTLCSDRSSRSSAASGKSKSPATRTIMGTRP